MGSKFAVVAGSGYLVLPTSNNRLHSSLKGIFKSLKHVASTNHVRRALLTCSQEPSYQ